ncbi:MAG: IS30 family transposase [Bacilli bacterium]
MSYYHFAIEERISIKHLLAKNVSIRQIAVELGQSPSSISREIKRNSTLPNEYGDKYRVQIAEKLTKKRVSIAHNIIQFPLVVIQIIEQRIKETWSPEQIAAFYKNEDFPCYKTIYKWIIEGTIANGNKALLRRKGKGGWYETRGKHNRGKSIRKRDKMIYKRADYGHWEIDTVVSGLGKSKACFITLIERKSRFYKAIKSPNRNADIVARLIIDYLKQFPSELVKTITTDNGKEFAEWKQIEKELNCEIYFCDTFCAWQKGSNENTNGLLREFFPKGYNLSRFTQSYIDKKVDLINNRPRKCNNWISPSKLMHEAISECCT